jgi:hypothetical protein
MNPFAREVILSYHPNFSQEFCVPVSFFEEFFAFQQSEDHP